MFLHSLMHTFIPLLNLGIQCAAHSVLEAGEFGAEALAFQVLWHKVLEGIGASSLL